MALVGRFLLPLAVPTPCKLIELVAATTLTAIFLRAVAVEFSAAPSTVPLTNPTAQSGANFLIIFRIQTPPIVQGFSRANDRTSLSQNRRWSEFT